MYAHEVADVIRPLPWLETGNSEHSLFAYMEALAGAYEDYEQNVDDVNFETYFTKNVYHVPFSGMSFRAHKRLMHMTSDATIEEVQESFKNKVLPSITYSKDIGGTYGGSIFIALLATIDTLSLKEGDRIGVFSYGSGSCAEYYSFLVTETSKETAKKAGLKALIDNRYKITVPQYEAMENFREQRIKEGDFTPDYNMVPGLYDVAYKGKGLLIYEGSEGYYRKYKFS